MHTLEPFIFMNATYDSASRLISLETKSGQENLQYDSLGNLIIWQGDWGRKEYEYGYDNRLREVKIGNKEIKFSYTALGYRWKKEANDKVYEYLYGVEGNLLYERILEDGKLKEERYYIYVPGRLDRPVAMVIKKGRKYEVYYYIHNHQGSVIVVVDRKGRVVNIYDYWADGNMRYIEEKIKQPFLYTGAYYDRETGLYYLRARYYSPELRRFIQRDPILFEVGINLYGYTGCDFVNYGDWEGRLFGPPMGPPICKQIGTCGCEEPNTGCRVNWTSISRCLLGVYRESATRYCAIICSLSIASIGYLKEPTLMCAACIATGMVYIYKQCLSPNISCK